MPYFQSMAYINMQIQKNISLKSFNSFAIDAKARYFSKFSNIEELSALTTYYLPAGQAGSRLTTFILGGGSNVLFTRDYDGLVLKNEIMGIETIKEDNEHVYVKAGAGENWHNLVLYCINNNWAGIENLSLIPGNTGAAPIQNIGAYGVEFQDVFHELTAYHLNEKSNYTFGLKDCKFSYRDSIFKKEHKDQFAVTSITLRLNKKPVFHTAYGAVEQELERMGVSEISINAISQAVINIRTSKLPDTNVIPNAGSFFKNPVISNEQFLKLSAEYNGMPNYPQSDGSVKLAAGWLIEQCGWKGFRRGDTGCHPKQALVLVNYGNATGKEIYNLSEEIFQSVKEKFRVILDREVNVF